MGLETSLVLGLILVLVLNPVLSLVLGHALSLVLGLVMGLVPGQVLSLVLGHALSLVLGLVMGLVSGRVLSLVLFDEYHCAIIFSKSRSMKKTSINLLRFNQCSISLQMRILTPFDLFTYRTVVRCYIRRSDCIVADRIRSSET